MEDLKNIKWIASFTRFGSPSLYKVDLIGETAKTFTAVEVKRIFGSIYFGRWNKKDNMTIIVDTPAEAVSWIISKLHSRRISLQREINEITTDMANYSELVSMLSEDKAE